MADMRKAKIGDRLFNVIEPNNYNSKFNNDGLTAICTGDCIYPVKTTVTMNQPGVYFNDGGNPEDGINVIGRYVEPTEEERSEYSKDNIIDLSANSMKERIEKSKKLKEMERNILITTDNVYVPKIDDNDSPEMKGIKQAVIYKNCDLDKYQDRIGANYNNDKRLLAKHVITLAKMKSITNALDLKMTLIIEDTSPDVPNPMGRTVVVDLSNIEEE